MSFPSQAFNSEHPLAQEHLILLRQYGGLQRRCTEQAHAQAQEIACLQKELMRLRALLLARESTLAWEREDHVRALESLRQCAGRGDAWQMDPSPAPEPRMPIEGGASSDPLESRLSIADLVICQTGCVSHGAYWRVEDHCKRTGKACVLVDQPGALRVVRVHPSGDAEQLAASPPMNISP